MGKVIFTREQQIVFDEIKKNEFITSNFYFTGGTALSSVYLHHRESDDLDFFSEKKFDTLPILNFISELREKYRLEITSTDNEVVKIFFFNFPKKVTIKVDFGYYPYSRINKGKRVDSLEVDSELDIAINKLLTIQQRSDPKDFVDLYFLLKKFTVWTLIDGVKIKFKLKLEPILVAADYMKVENFEALPKMLVPLKLKDLQDFFRKQALQIGKRVVKK